MDKQAVTLSLESKSFKAAKIARNLAANKSLGKCARYIRIALQKAGYRFIPCPSAYTYAIDILPKIGFVKIDINSVLQIGDIMVFNKNKHHIHGHIQIWDGTNWVSDNIQSNWLLFNLYSISSCSLWRDKNHVSNINSIGDK